MRPFGVAKTKAGGVGFDKQKLTRLMEPMRDRLNGVVIENISYERCFQNYDSKDSFFFIDSPYLNTQQHAYDSWSEDDLKLLRKRVDKLQGKWIVTLNDLPFTRDLFSDCKIQTASSASGTANRGGKNVPKLSELIITPS